MLKRKIIPHLLIVSVEAVKLDFKIGFTFDFELDFARDSFTIRNECILIDYLCTKRNIQNRMRPWSSCMLLLVSLSLSLSLCLSRYKNVNLKFPFYSIYRSLTK